MMSAVDSLTLLLIVIIVLTVFYYYRSVNSVRQRFKPVQVHKEETEEDPRVKELVECPRCSRIMEQGYVIGPSGIFWSNEVPLYMGGEIRWQYALGAPFGAEPLTSPLLGGMGRIPHLKANRCSSCKLLYVDLARQDVNID